MVMTPLLNLVLALVDEAKAGMASGVISTVQQVGAALGVAVVGIFFAAALPGAEGSFVQAGQYAHGFVAGMLYNLGAAVMVIALLVMLAGEQRSGGGE